ncbi:Serine/threonine-protein kinase, partial [Coemansia thaxteri]
ATGDADLSYDLKATTNSQAPKPSRASSASCAADGARDPAADQTAAAIEALSLHPRARGSTPLSTAGAAGALQAPGVQDSKKKRPNIFKRFSVIVKGARPSHKQPSIPLDPASRIIQIEGGESGYMEISLDDQGGRGDHGRNADDHQDDNKLQASGQRLEEPARAPTDLDVTSGRQRSNAGAERYSALDNIDENREYAHSEHIAGELASRSPAVAAAAAVEADGHLTSGVVAVPTGQLPNDAARQYLSELLSANQSPGHLSEEASVPTAKPWGPGIAGTQDTAPLAHAKSGHSPVCNLADHEDPRPSSRSDASYSLEDLGGASSMFTNSELDEAEASLQASSARHGELAADGREAGSPLSGKAALLDRARREIEGFDEHEGVGLLDQTPELSYRVAGQSSGPNFDAKKRRTRSSSNTVARVLSEIVREGSGGSNGNNRNGKRALRAGSGLHSRTTKGTTPLDAGAPNQAPPAKTIPRHNSTGAINSAGGSGYFEDLVVGGTQGAMQSVEAKRSDAASGVGFSRPDILRSHSHAPNARPQGFVLPERIAEVSEPPTPYEPWSDSALRQDADKVLRTEAFFASPKHADSVPAGNGGRGGPSNGLGGTAVAGQQTSGTGMVEFKLSPDLDLPAPYDTSDTSDLGNIASAPPRADEHLKPVFLKGLFSVSTTSTRSPTAIRDNLLGVLSDMPLRFHEGKGYFTCSMATTTGPGNLQGDALGSLAQDDMTTSLSSGLHKPKRSLRLPVVDRKISFRRRPKPSDKVPLAPAAHISTRLAATRDDMSSNEENLSVSHHSVADLSSDDAKDHRCQPATETATETVVPFAQSATKSANCNAICFQIFLVRMPLLGLCGLQFRRVSGPTWKYKDLCSEILKRLKL